MRLAGIRGLVVVLGLSLGATVCPMLGDGAARAQSSQSRGVEILNRAARSYEAGAYADASALIESAFKAGLTGEYAGRAILLRAEINERTGALAKALQDYSNALWMETLPPAERKEATDGKARVLAAMGMSAPGASPATQASAPASAGQPQGGSSSGVFGFLSDVFGGSEKSPPPPQPVASPQTSELPAPAPAPAAPPPKAPKPAKPAQAKPAPAPVQASAQPASALSVDPASGGVLIVFGAASSEAAGRSTAKQLKAQLSDILINRQLDVTQKAGGGFQIQAGPYKTKGPALALCSAMKQRGVQCQVTP